MLATHTFNTGELMLSYAEGPANGPPLLMLHGLLGRWQDFEPFIAALTPDWHVYGCDFRGHGQSDRAPEGSGYTLGDLMRDVSVFVREVLPVHAPIVLVGFSGGGLGAIPLAAAFPERVRGIVALEPAFMLRDSSITAYPVAQEIGWAHHAAKTARSFGELVAMCREVFPEAGEQMVLSMAERLSKADPRLSDLELVDRALDGMDLDSMMRRVRCPILIVRGEPSLGSVVRDEDVAWAAANNSHIRVLRVPGGGHGVPFEQADTVLGHVMAFLDELRQSTKMPPIEKTAAPVYDQQS